MMNKILVSMIFFDVFVLVLIILAGFNGYRRGGLRAFLSMFWIYISLICTMMLYNRIAMSMQVTFDAASSLSRLIGFISIFAITFTITRTFNIFVEKWLRSVVVESKLSSILGIIFGAIEALLMVGIIFMNMSFYPVTPPLSDSLSFKSLYRVPYKVAEYSLWFAPDLVASDKPIIEPSKQPGLFDEDYGLGK